MTSLKTLAEALDLSITQVSRALDDKPDVSAKTKARVREMAARLGYAPNAAARSLRKRRADLVAMVLPSSGNQVGLGALLGLMHAVAERLSAHGLDLTMIPGRSPRAETETLKRIVDGRRADAVLLVRTHRRDERVEFLAARGVPFVTFGRTDSDMPHAYVDGDGEAGFAAATRDLARLGHRRIAHIAAPATYMFAHTRRSGWLSAMTDLGLDPTGLETEADMNTQGGYDAARRLLAMPSPPTALLYATDAMALGAYAAAREYGLEPGKSIAIVGHDNLAAGRLMSPQLSTMEIASDRLGEMLADHLCARMDGRDPRDLQQVLDVRQVPRQSRGAETSP